MKKSVMRQGLMKRYIAILALALGLAISASAQKTPVSLDCTTHDRDLVGKRLCTELHDDIARSPRYRETTTQEPHVGLHIITIPVNDSLQASAESVTVTFHFGSGNEVFLTDAVLVTSSKGVARQAQSLLADIDKELDGFAKILRSESATVPSQIPSPERKVERSNTSTGIAWYCTMIFCIIGIAVTIVTRRRAIKKERCLPAAPPLPPGPVEDTEMDTGAESSTVTTEKTVMTETGTIGYDANWDNMACSCGNNYRAIHPEDEPGPTFGNGFFGNGFKPLSDISGLGRFRLFILDWLVRLRVVPVGAVSPIFTCSCGAIYCISPAEFRAAENRHRLLLRNFIQLMRSAWAEALARGEKVRPRPTRKRDVEMEMANFLERGRERRQFAMYARDALRREGVDEDKLEEGVEEMWSEIKASMEGRLPTVDDILEGRTPDQWSGRSVE
jgi:hypothetical protein